MVIHYALEITHNVAKTCRYYGIGRTEFYEWYNRYQKEGEEGPKILIPASKLVGLRI